VPAEVDHDRIAEVLSLDHLTAAEQRRLARIAVRLATPPPPADPHDLFPRYEALRSRFLARVADGDGEAAEEALLELYAHLHMHAAPYTATERRAMDAAGGYWSHAGGLSPVLRAGPWITPGSRSIDLGAGNGLQCLLLQLLDPHRLTVQVEIAGRMVAIGRRLQRWLEVPGERVRWVAGDVRSVRVVGFDFVYLYRPVRPDGPARDFYHRLAGDLEASPRPPVVLSIADCLGEFLSDAFVRHASDGHLTVWRRRDREPPDDPETGPRASATTSS